jgi:hypothetical protein
MSVTTLFRLAHDLREANVGTQSPSCACSSSGAGLRYKPGCRAPRRRLRGGAFDPHGIPGRSLRAPTARGSRFVARDRGLSAVPAHRRPHQFRGRFAPDLRAHRPEPRVSLGSLSIAATNGIAPQEQGLPGGLFNTSFQLGPSCWRLSPRSTIPPATAGARRAGGHGRRQAASGERA